MASTIVIGVLVGLGLLSLVSCRSFPDKPVLDPRCPEVEDEDSDLLLFPHETDCDKYMVCSNGYAVVMKCQPGLLFNPVYLACDWPHNVECPFMLETS